MGGVYPCPERVVMTIGLVGFGFMGKTHAYTLHNLHYFYKDLPFEAKIKTVCTAHIETARAAAEQYGFARYTDNVDELLNDAEIDIIDICTPNVAHFEVLKKAIEAGKHVYCEKPLCVTAAEAHEIAELAKEKGIVGQIVFNNRFLPPILRAKEIIEAGEIGEVVSFRSAYLHASCTDPDKNAGWKQNKDICGGGVLFDLGSHALDLVYYLCGPFKNLQGMGQIHHKTRRGMKGERWQTNADEAFYMLCELENGAMGTVEANKLAFGTNDDFSIEIYGEKGALKFNLMDPNWLYYYDGSRKGGDYGGDRGFTRIECVGRYPAPGGVFPGVKAPIGWLSGHVESMRCFLDCVYRGKQACPSFDDAAHIQWAMEEAYLSDGNLRLLDDPLEDQA